MRIAAVPLDRHRQYPTRLYATFDGNKITLTGGVNALKTTMSSQGGSEKDYEITCKIPFELTAQRDGGTNKFDCTCRVTFSGDLTGDGLLWFNCASACSTLKCANSCAMGSYVTGSSICDLSHVNALGDGKKKAVFACGGGGMRRLYSDQNAWFDVRPPTTWPDSEYTFTTYNNRVLNGPVTGERLVLSAESASQTFTMNGDVTIDGPVHAAPKYNGLNLVFNGRLSCVDFGRSDNSYTGNATFNHADNAITNFYAYTKNAYAGAKNCFGPHAIVRFGRLKDDQSLIDCKGFDQQIDRIEMVNAYKVSDSGDYPGEGHVFTSSTGPARLTLAATEDCETDAKFSGALTLVWAPAEAHTFRTYAAYGRALSMSGAIVVSNGTFEVNGANSFPNATALVVADGAVFDWQSSVLDGFSTAKRVELGATATVRLPAGMTIPVSSLVVDGQSMPSGMYSSVARAGVAQLPQLQGEGTLYVKPQGGGVVSAVWVGGGADDQVTTVENWAGLGEWPSMTDAVFLPTFADRESTSENAVLAEPVVWRGVVFDAGRSFSLTPDGEGASLSLGASGILARAPGEGTRAYAIGTPVVPVADQSWECPASAPLTLSGPLDQEMGGAPYTICKQGAGTLTLSGGGSFAGDVVSSNGTIRLSGTHSGSGQISLMSNSAVVVLDNADVAKSVSARCNGSFPSTIQTVTNSTNWIRGGLTTVQDGATPQPNIVLGAKSSLTVEGDFLKDGTYWTVKGSGELCVTNCETVKMGCLTLADSVTVRLQQTCFTTKAANYITVNSGTTLRTEVENALTQSPVQLSGLWDLCGKDQTMGRLSWSGNTNRAVTTSMEIRSTQPARLTIIHNDKSGSGSNRGWSIYAGKVTGQVSLLKRGDQTLYLGSALAATGTLEVAEGVLSVTNGVHVYGGKNYPVCGSWTNCSSVTASETGVLEILHSDAFGKATDVYIAKGAKVRLGAGVSQRVHDLYFEDDGGEWVKQKSGVWGTTASGASNKSDIFFDGPGVLRALGDGQGMTLVFR